jgi:hypothetical protein
MRTSPVVFSSFFKSAEVWASTIVGTAALNSAAKIVVRSILSPPRLSIGGTVVQVLCCPAGRPPERRL